MSVLDRELILRRSQQPQCGTQEDVGKDQSLLQQAEARRIVLCELTWATERTAVPSSIWCGGVASFRKDQRTLEFLETAQHLVAGDSEFLLNLLQKRLLLASHGLSH